MIASIASAARLENDAIADSEALDTIPILNDDT